MASNNVDCNTCVHLAKNIDKAKFAVLRLQYGITLYSCLTDYHQTEKVIDIKVSNNIIPEHLLSIGSCSDHEAEYEA